METRRDPLAILRRVSITAVFLTFAGIYYGLFYHDELLPPAGFTRARVVLFGLLAGFALVCVAGILARRTTLLGIGIFGLTLLPIGSILLFYLAPLIALLVALFFLSHGRDRDSTGD